jgi:DNA polymerase I-like protein with 3'-5' exonuclease and polymerase domains
MRDKVYGAKVFQRITQSLARDIMAEHTTNINKRYWVAGLVHDEVICVVPDAEVEDAKTYITKMMRTAPAWAPDLPLDCEVGSGKRYGSAK